MDINIKKEIISSYEKLINDCKISIENEIDIDKNKILIEEYNNVLKQVKKKPKSAYDDVIEEMKKIANKKNILKVASDEV